MGKYLKLFENVTQYQEYITSETAVLPNVSHCIQEGEVHYNPWVEPFLCKLTIYNGDVVEVEGSGELTSAMTSAYSAICVSAEIGTKCTSIGNCTFKNWNGLSSVTIGNSVTSIGEEAFTGCNRLTSVTIPNSVTSIGRFALNFSHNLVSVTIPNSVTTIGEATFQECVSLTNVTIPNSVTSIGDYAFKTCIGLTSVTIGSGVTSIGREAFNGCRSLTSVTIPNSVTSIGNYAFQSCSGLTSITSLATTAPTIKSDTFYSVSNGGTLTVPSGSSGYDTWMQNTNYYLGLYNWTKVEQ